MALIRFPYEDVRPMEIPDGNLMGIFSPPPRHTTRTEQEIIASALASPIGIPPLAETLKNKRRVMIVSDDHHRPTPVRTMLPLVLDVIMRAGIPREGIEIVMALGSHRLMHENEMREKVGSDIVDGFKVSNHDWTDADNLYFAGRVPPGIDVWVNKKMREFDYIIGLGQIMPMDVCGFTGGCNIIIPGLCGPKTSSDFHWIRTGIPAEQVIGLRENPIREAIDNSAMVAGLNAILNVVLDDEGKICHAVYGHPIEAHKAAVPVALKAHSVLLPRKADIVVADGFPFDVEFWQVNKALDNAALAVRPGGVIIIVSPCYEGVSVTHGENILNIGYRSKKEIFRLVEEGKFVHRVAAVHMIQVADATIEQNVECVLVTRGISAENVRRLNLTYAPDAQQALAHAFARVGNDARVAVLRRASETLPIVQEQRT